MNPFVQFLQMLASGGGAAGASAPVGLLAGGKGAEAAANVAKATPTASQAAPIQSAPQGLLGGLQNMIGKERGGDLMSMGAAMMQNNGPSLNPASGSFLSGLGAGMGALQQSQSQRADTDLKKAVTQAQIGNYNSSAAQNTAQAALLQSQAAAEAEGRPGPVFAGAGAAAAPVAAPGQVIQSTAPTTPTAPATEQMPEAGKVYEGYRFKGGNPQDPAAWERA